MNQTGEALSFVLSIWQAAKVAEEQSMRNGGLTEGETSCEEIDAMDDGLVWEKISTAPYDRDLELAVVEGDRVHPLVFACRRTAHGWIKISSMERVTISPTHWRVWQGKA
jgi:hypothetical protein